MGGTHLALALSPADPEARYFIIQIEHKASIINGTIYGHLLRVKKLEVVGNIL
jgi:hypothetical protein